MVRRIGSRQEQYLGFFRQQRGDFLAAIIEVAQHEAALGAQRKVERRLAVIPVGWCQRHVDDAPREVSSNVQLKAEGLRCKD